jgi:hypothetical protein
MNQLVGQSHKLRTRRQVATAEAEVTRVLNENRHKLHELPLAAIPKIGPQPEDVCSTALAAVRI